jgi:uncharacterized membrane protein
MEHFWEILLGLERGFLSRQGEWSWQFNPDWPFQKQLDPLGGAVFYNLVLIALGLTLVVYVYRREAKPAKVRVLLAITRALLLGMVLILLNRPVLTLEQQRKEPSVLAVMVDDTISMSVPDVVAANHGPPRKRIDAAVDLLTGNNGELLRTLGKNHDLQIYRFGRDAEPIASITGLDSTGATTQPVDPVALASRQIAGIGATEDGTQLVHSVQTVLEELAGQRLAGIVVLTDGRDVPVRERAEEVGNLRTKFSVPIYSVAIGQDKPPKNIEIEKPDYEPSAFVDDYTVVKFSVKATGFQPNHKIHVVLRRRKDNQPVLDIDGKPVTVDVTLSGDQPVPAEISFMPALAMNLNPRNLPEELAPENRSLDLVLAADKEPGVINPGDAVRDLYVDVLDNQVHLLFVDGLPRWEYRYIKNSLVRDKSMKVNCLLTSADPTFVQEASDGVTPIAAFPTTLDELLQYDVVLFGDVDQHEFSDAQLQLINDFVSKRGGGFGMIAGMHYSPPSFKNTPIQPILPVDIERSESDDDSQPITEGFHLALTPEGMASPIFRFFADRQENQKYVEQDSPPLFWYCHNVLAKPLATVLAEHPRDLALGSDKRAPLLVVGQFGAGRTLFSAIDESWRWRFYTGEDIFNAYWVQQVRYLARNRKLDERTVMFESERPEYQLGDTVALDLTVLSPTLAQVLPPQIAVEILDAAGQPARTVELQRMEGTTKFAAAWPADTVGRFVARLPALGSGVAVDRPFLIKLPQSELETPETDRSMLASLGRVVDLDSAKTDLPRMIHSLAKTIPVEITRPLWDAPIALIVFALLITAEWVCRKAAGML